MAGKEPQKADIKVAKRQKSQPCTRNHNLPRCALMKLGDAIKMEVDKISTGSIAIDLALGIGGLMQRACL